MIENYLLHLKKWSHWLLLATLVAFTGLGIGIPRLEFTVDYRAFFSMDNPELKEFEQLQRVYGDSDNILFVVAPKNGDILTERNISAIYELTAQAKTLPFSVRTDSITNFKHISHEGDVLTVKELVNNYEEINTQSVKVIKEVVLNDKRLVDRLISGDGRVAGINITTLLPGEDITTEVTTAARKSKALLSEFRNRYPEIDFYATGILMMNNALTEVPLDDMQRLMPVLFFIVGLLSSYLLHSWKYAMVTLSVVGLSIVGAMGLAGWGNVLLTPPSAVSPIIILPLAVANCMHVLVSYRSSLSGGLANIDAVARTLRFNIKPVIVTNLTTMVGFFGLNFSSAPPFRDLGNIVGVGVIIVLFLTLFLVPLLLLRFPSAPGEYQATARIPLGGAAKWVIDNYRKITYISVLVVVTSLYLSTNNALNDEFVKYFDESVSFRHDTEFTTDNLTGLYLLEYSIESTSEHGVNDPLYLEQLQAFSTWFRQQPAVMHVRNLADTIEVLHSEIKDSNFKTEALPSTRQLVAQELLLYEMSLPTGSDITDEMAFDKSASRMTVALRSISSNELLALEGAAHQWLERNAPLLKTKATGSALMFAKIGSRNIKTMLIGTTVALLVISGLLVIALGSWKYGMLSLVPNLLPAALAFGIWGVLDGEVGMALSVVTCLTLGIIVDDTVHFVSKYQHAIKEFGYQPEQAIRYTYETVGAAIWMTSVILVAGFSVLFFSKFVPNGELGLLTSITIVCALAADLILLPALLLLVDDEVDRAVVN